RLPESETVVEGPVVTGGNIVGTNEVVGGLLFRITEPTATITVPVFDDGPNEGEEDLTFTLQNGEGYEVNSSASSVSVNINDGGETAIYEVESGVTSVSLDLPLLEAAGITLLGADSQATPFSEDFQVGFEITPATDLRFAPAPFTPAGGTIEHSGTITLGLGEAQATIGNFSIGIDPTRASDKASGFFLADTLEDPLGLGVLFDISAPGVLSVAGEDLKISNADLLVAPELANALGQSDLAGADIGDARVDASVDTVPEVTFSADKTTLVESNQDFIELSFNVDGRIPAEGLPVSIKVNTTDPSKLFFVDFSAGDFEFESGTPNVQDPGNIWEFKGADDGTDSGLKIVKDDDIFAIVEPPYDTINLILTENTASIRLPILDDVITEEDETVTFTLEESDSYRVPATNAPITVTLKDGDPSVADGPTVSLSANATNVIEGQEITFTIDLDQAPPTDGVRILIDSDIVASTGEFDVERPTVDTDGDGVGDTRFVEGVTLTGVADPFSLQPNEDGSGFFVTVTEQQATLTLFYHFRERINSG
ncbi:MAG: hypothetical protein MJK14_26330, partial [Rivularia sp. ALOHA_DT_140]|nr:hypothetical protein [Rivularia sp. ALOHA_DT_140]